MVDCTFNTDGICSVLTVERCNERRKKVCEFIKTAEQDQQDREKANARLRSLPSDLQYYIAGKYYKGIRVWKEKRGTNIENNA